MSPSARNFRTRIARQNRYTNPLHTASAERRHTLGTRLINRDVPQHVVQKILDHDSPGMTALYARLHDTTVRRHWENARKVNIAGDTVTLDPAGQVADAAWAKQRLGRATQALPNGYCAIPVIAGPCPHPNACLNCAHFRTDASFLDVHKSELRETERVIEKARTNGWARQSEMNERKRNNLVNIITSLEQVHA